MKKVFTLVATALIAVATNQAQAQALSGNKFFDNWSVGVNVGATSPITPYTWKPSAFKKNLEYKDHRNVEGFSWDGFRKGTRMTFGLELTKQWNPMFATGLEGVAYVNTTPSKTAIDQLSGLFFTKFNLTNIFCGYKGAPRTFELQARAGMSWNAIFVSGKREDVDALGAKVGLDFDFNLGKRKAWTLSFKPSANYNLDDQFYYQPASKNGLRFDKNALRIEMQAGLTYHFSNSNGAHHFLKVRPYNQGEVDRLNKKIDALRGEVSERDAEINDLNARINDVERELEAARSQKPQVVVVEDKAAKDMDIYVYFRQSKSVIDRSQAPNIERIAIFLKNNKDAKVSIKGYTSPEGSLEFNKALSIARAEAVKEVLVKKYRISADRITTEGMGVGKIFSDPNWNRVSISTIEKK